MEQRIIFLDIDGTIAEPGSMAPVPSALEAMERAKARGHKLVLCSGRGYNALRPMLDFGYDAVVANAGAYIICDGQALVDYALSPETVRRTRDLLEEAEILYSIMCRNGFYNSPGYRDLIIQSAHRGSNSELSRWIKFFENEEDVTLANYREEPVQKFIFLARSPQQLQGPIAALEDEFECCVMGTDQFGTTNGELIHRTHGKGAAIRVLCGHWGLPLSASVAFGDSMNDASMLATAGLGICMGNGSDELKVLADEVCPPYDQDGVLRAMETHGLI